MLRHPQKQKQFRLPVEQQPKQEVQLSRQVRQESLQRDQTIQIKVGEPPGMNRLPLRNQQMMREKMMSP